MNKATVITSKSNSAMVDSDCACTNTATAKVITTKKDKTNYFPNECNCACTNDSKAKVKSFTSRSKG